MPALAFWSEVAEAFWSELLAVAAFVSEVDLLVSGLVDWALLWLAEEALL